MVSPLAFLVWWLWLQIAQTDPKNVPPGWWTSEHVLALTNVLLAGAALAAIFVSWNATRRTLEKSDAQLSLDTDSFRATLQPIIVETAASPDDIDIAIFPSSHIIEIRVRMRNVGRGPAFIRKAEITNGRAEPTEIAVPSNNVVPVNEPTTIFYDENPGRTFFGLVAGGSEYEFAVALNYDDISGAQRTRTVMRVKVTAQGAIEILGVGIYHCDENWRRERDPFAGFDPYAHDIDSPDATQKAGS
jgi:hypothetical protein